MTNQPMNQNVILNNLKNPVLITAFSSPQKGGATATSALNYAIERWEAEPVMTFESEGFYNYGRMRPWVRRVGDETVIDWPENTVYRVDGPDRSYLLLVGVEPSMNWREFVTGIGEFAARTGVETAVSLKAVPAMVPHTVNSPVRAIYSHPELQEEYPFEELEDQDGPADIGRVLNLYLAAEGCDTLDLYAMEPFYAAAIPDATAALGLLEALRTGLDLTVDTEAMVEAANVQRKAIDAAMASSDQLRDTVIALEQRAGAVRPIGEGPAAMTERQAELDVSSILREAQDIIGDFGTGGTGGGASEDDEA